MQLRAYDLSHNPLGAMLHRRQDQTSINRNLWDSLLQDLSVLAGCVQVGDQQSAGSGPAGRKRDSIGPKRETEVQGQDFYLLVLGKK